MDNLFPPLNLQMTIQFRNALFVVIVALWVPEIPALLKGGAERSRKGL
jgi:hypothetical protein